MARSAAGQPLTRSAGIRSRPDPRAPERLTGVLAGLFGFAGRPVQIGVAPTGLLAMMERMQGVTMRNMGMVRSHLVVTRIEVAVCNHVMLRRQIVALCRKLVIGVVWIPGVERGRI